MKKLSANYKVIVPFDIILQSVAQFLVIYMLRLKASP